MYLASQAVLPLHYYGRTSGVVLNSGHDFTHCGIFSEDHTPIDLSEKIKLAGHEITLFLQKVLVENGLNFITAGEMQLVRLIKENHAYVALNYGEEMEAAQ